MEIQIKELLARLDERSFHMSEKTDSILEQLTKLNSKVALHEKEISQIKIELAQSNGVKSGINRAVMFIITIMGILVGALATMLWH